MISNIEGARDHHTPWGTSHKHRQVSHDTTYICNLKKNDAKELIYKVETDFKKKPYGY